MVFTIKYGSANSVTGNSEEWGVETVGQAISHERARATLRHPDNVLIFMGNVAVGADHPLSDGADIRLQKTAAEKG
jgi:hypothetical protein